MKKASTTSNHEKAPLCAAFVKAMREAFGDVKVTWVKENGIELGAKDESEWVVATVVPVEDVSLPRSRKEAGADAGSYAATLLETEK